MFFRGRKHLGRRRKGLITAGDWRAPRIGPPVSLGDKSFTGNRHFRLSGDALTCTVRVHGHAANPNLPEMRGKGGHLLRAVSALAVAREINVEFRLELLPSMLDRMRRIQRRRCSFGMPLV